jgi:acetyl esterase/lipase
MNSISEKTHPDHLAAIKNHLKQGLGYETTSIEQVRSNLDAAAAMFPLPSSVHIEPFAADGLSGEWVIPVSESEAATAEADPRPGSPEQVILYLHGGGFIAGGCASYRRLAAQLALAAGTKVLLPAYRLAPEHLYPAANEDALAAYNYLLHNGYAPDRIVLAGDSVGASLVLMTLLTLRDEGEQLPAGACLLSPHTDLIHLDGESYESHAELDPTGSRTANQRIIRDYLGLKLGNELGNDKPAILSPLRMNLKGLPPLLIQVGDQEVLWSDAVRLAEKAQLAEVPVTFEPWENMWCGFQLMDLMLPEACEAIRHIGAFVQACQPGASD